jgi:hypothetical protein
MDNKWSKYIKLFEDFSEKSYPQLIKKVCLVIRKDIESNGDKSFKKVYNIDGLNILININFRVGNKQPYYSNINIYDIIRGIEPHLIEFSITDLEIDLNYLMGIISHEIRHIYDILTTVDDLDFKDFLKSKVITEYKKEGINKDFINLVYLSLEHEMISRHNMLYEMFRWQGITDKTDLYKLFEKSYTYEALNKLKTFDINILIKSDDIYDFTDRFSRSIGDEFDGDILKYYNRWNDFFIKKSDEFLNYVDSMLDDTIDDIKNDRIFERMCGYISYNEDIGNNVYKRLLIDMVIYKNK